MHSLSDELTNYVLYLSIINEHYDDVGRRDSGWEVVEFLLIACFISNWIRRFMKVNSSKIHRIMYKETS